MDFDSNSNYRLHSSGISGKILLWITDFLANRCQKVRIGNSYSDSIPVLSGVIQGSVLGPTLFNIFVNNIDTSIKFSYILKYADDLRIYLASTNSDSALKDLHFKLQHDIDKIANWVSDSGMALNISKCFQASFGKSPTPRSYSISGSTIPNKSLFKDLGVLVSVPLSFNKDIDHIVSKAFIRLGLVRKIFHTRSPEAILRLFKAYVRPILEYASIIWNPSAKTYKSKTERVQRRMCRMIPALRQLPYSKQLKHLRLYSLQARRQRYQLITLFKFSRNLTDFDFYSLFEVRTTSKTRGHKLKIVPKFTRHKYRQNFFTNSSVHLWNKLTDEDINAPNITQFKKRIELLLQNESIW